MEITEEKPKLFITVHFKSSRLFHSSQSHTRLSVSCTLITMQ